MKDKNERYYKAFIGFLNDVTDEKIYDLFDVDVSREDDAGRKMSDGRAITPLAILCENFLSTCFDPAPNGKLEMYER